MKQAFAVRNADDTTVYAYGTGTLTEEVPERGFLKDLEITNPTITLPSGDKVYGFECWWMDIEKKDAFVGEREVIIVPPPK